MWLKDPLLVVSGYQIQFRKVFRSSEPVDKFVDAREGVSVLAGDPVQSSIVDTHAKRAVLFSGKEDRGAVW
jgi:hypothetical protein